MTHLLDKLRRKADEYANVPVYSTLPPPIVPMPKQPEPGLYNWPINAP